MTRPFSLVGPPRPDAGAAGAAGGAGAGCEISLLEALRVVPPRVARSHRIVPLRYAAGRLIVGAAEPRRLQTLDTLRRLGHAEVELVAVSEERFREIFDTWYGPAGEVATLVAELPREEPAEPSPRAGEEIAATPAPRFLDLTLRAALAEGASDVHVEADARAPRVRFRLDGVLAERVAPPAWLAGRVVGRIKALAGLALGDSLSPQDGAFELPTAAGPIAVRVSILPTVRGECAVLRLLAAVDDVPTLADLVGVAGAPAAHLAAAAAAADGLIVFAGPTGSGKTTSLHALLQGIDGTRRNIVSIEDPVEIRSRRLRQVPVRGGGLDFAGALRAVLRQDPDVILVGETRDAETADLVMQAALAGHLVLTTVHAASALGAFDRLAQLGAARALLADVVRLAVSQRLLRRRCAACGGEGCFTCEGSGLKGRVAVYETLPMSPRLAGLVRRGAAPGEILRAARERGFVALRDAARDLERSGVTTAAEIARVLDADVGADTDAVADTASPAAAAPPPGSGDPLERGAAPAAAAPSGAAASGPGAGGDR